MRFYMNFGKTEVNATVDADERDSILRGIIHGWRCKPEMRKSALGSSEFPTKFQEHGMPGCYELDRDDLKLLFTLLKHSGIGVDRDLSEEEKRKSEDEQQKIYKFLKRTLKKETLAE